MSPQSPSPASPPVAPVLPISRAEQLRQQLLGSFRVGSRLPRLALLRFQERRLRTAIGEAIQLPFNLDTVLKSYVYNAYTLGILTGRGMGLEPLCARYIQLVFPDSKLTAAGRHRAHFRFFPMMKIEHLTALGYFSVSEWPTEAIDRPHRALVGGLLEALARGRYLLVRANEFYMPHSAAYLRMDFRHGFLITGYDPQRRCFLGPAYGRDREFRAAEIPALFMAEALRSKRGGMSSAYNESRQILEVEPTSRRAEPADAEEVFAQLGDYLRGTDNSQKYLDGPFLPAPLARTPLDRVDWQERGTYGLRVYDSFRRYMSGLIADRDVIDLRATRVLMDHKQVVSATLRVLVAAGRVGSAAAAGYAEVVGLGLRLHQNAFAWNMSRDPESGRRVFDALEDLRAAETEILSAVYARDRRRTVEGASRAS